MGSWNFSHIGIDVKNDEMRTLAEQLMECIYPEGYDRMGSECFVDDLAGFDMDYSICRNYHRELAPDRLYALANVLFGETTVYFEHQEGTTVFDWYKRDEVIYDGEDRKKYEQNVDYCYGDSTVFGKNYNGRNIEKAGTREKEPELIATGFPVNAPAKVAALAQEKGYSELAALVMEKCGEDSAEVAAFAKMMEENAKLQQEENDRKTEQQYQSALELMKKNDYKKAAVIFKKILEYKDSEAMASKCKEQQKEKDYDAATKKLEKGEYGKAAAVFKKLKKYKDSEAMALKCEEQQKETEYQGALQMLSEGKYRDAFAAFLTLNEYKDSKEMVQKCKEQQKEDMYQNALKMKAEGKFAGAIAAFLLLNGYKDSPAMMAACEEQRKESEYQSALQMQAEGKYGDAIAAFLALKEYKDSEAMVSACREQQKEAEYQRALQMQAEGDYTNAMAAFLALKEYKDSAKRSESLYVRAARRRPRIDWKP